MNEPLKRPVVLGPEFKKEVQDLLTKYKIDVMLFTVFVKTKTLEEGHQVISHKTAFCGGLSPSGLELMMKMADNVEAAVVKTAFPLDTTPSPGCSSLN